MSPVRESEAALLRQAVEIAMQLAELALFAGDEVAAIHIAHGAELLRTRADSLDPLGQHPLDEIDAVGSQMHQGSASVEGIFRAHD